MAAPDEPHHTAEVRRAFELAVDQLTSRGADLVTIVAEALVESGNL
ncbi:MAG TPA: hypothetical protein VK923_13300 [Euzebyales bacterium]|nr:hypothetical protein [Euzebyales bacterium]